MSWPLVSVIVTYYNHASYIAQTVESVLNQTYPHLELIIVNDGSPDTSDFEQIINQYEKDSRLQVITQLNQGVAAARNSGLAASSGSYLSFLDSDDWLHLEKIARQVAFLEASPETGLVFCDVQRVNAEGQWLESSLMSERSSAPIEPHPFEALWIANYMEPSTPMFRREWYEQAGPLELGIEGHSDYEFWLRLSAMGCQFRYLPGRLVFYRVHDKNYTHKTELMTISSLNARKKIIEKFPNLVAEQSAKVSGKLYYFNLKLTEREKLVTYQGELISELHQKLARYQQDLSALQQTYSVRVSKALGELFARLKR
jgi:glycosyltransferase involved in cell wall biosynthesis